MGPVEPVPLCAVLREGWRPQLGAWTPEGLICSGRAQLCPSAQPASSQSPPWSPTQIPWSSQVPWDSRQGRLCSGPDYLPRGPLKTQARADIRDEESHIRRAICSETLEVHGFFLFHQPLRGPVFSQDAHRKGCQCGHGFHFCISSRHSG